MSIVELNLSDVAPRVGHRPAAAALRLRSPSIIKMRINRSDSK